MMTTAAADDDDDDDDEHTNIETTAKDGDALNKICQISRKGRNMHQQIHVLIRTRGAHADGIFRPNNTIIAARANGPLTNNTDTNVELITPSTIITQRMSRNNPKLRDA